METTTLEIDDFLSAKIVFASLATSLLGSISSVFVMIFLRE